MNTKGTLGVLVFILCVICIFHIYQSSELSFSSRGNIIEEDGDEDFSSTSVLSSYDSSYPDQTNEKDSPENSLSGLYNEHFHEQQEEDFYQHLKDRISHLEAPNSLYYQHHLERQRQRHAQLASTCSTMKKQSFSLSDMSRNQKNIWVNDKYKFVYCATPKAACTSWKSVLLVLDGIATSTDQFSQKTINSKSGVWMKQLWRYSDEEQKDIMKTYTKFMFSRNPFSRVLSAFQNKLAPNSTFERALKWQVNLGRKIITRYRNRPQRNKPYDLKFSEFGRYISDPSVHSFNKHWSLQYLQCRPCDLDYTILGHFETLEEDSKFILKVIGAENVVSFPSSNHSSPTNSSNESIFTSNYNTLSFDELKNLYEVYRKDFEMFGYPVPERLVGKV